MADKKIIVEREALSSLSSHIRTKSGSEAASLTWPQGFIDEIDNISAGVDVSGVTATAGDIIGPAKTFDLNGNLVTGTIQQQTSTNREITAASQTETISAGYYPSDFTVSIPSSAVTGLSAANMLDSATILGITGTIPTRTSNNLTVTTINDTKTIQAGYYPNSFTISVPSSVGTNLAANMLSSATVFGITGTIPTVSVATNTLSSEEDSIIIPSGYHASSTTITIDPTKVNDLNGSNIIDSAEILGVAGTISTRTTNTATITTKANPSAILPAGYYSNDITVNIDSSAIADVNSDNLLSSATILGVTGNIQEQTSTNRNITAASQVEMISAGYYPSNFTVSIPASATTGLDANKMLDTATILGITGNIPTNVSSNRVITHQSQIETITAGYYSNDFTVQSNLTITDSYDENGHKIRTIGGAS